VEKVSHAETCDLYLNHRQLLSFHPQQWHPISCQWRATLSVDVQAFRQQPPD
jgi:hypothetical protein